MVEILLATQNPGKLRELQRLTADHPWQWRTLRDFPQIPEAIEDGDTFADNAARKALHYAAATNLLTLADDSGLEVDALDGAPGVYSARYAGEPKSDAANNAKLISKLLARPDAPRTARFHCAIAVARDNQIIATATGSIAGEIVDTPTGDHGFGYDPHFYLPDLGQTMAQLDAPTKNRISHRGQALRALLPKLAKLLSHG